VVGGGFDRTFKTILKANKETLRTTAKSANLQNFCYLTCPAIISNVSTQLFIVRPILRYLKWPLIYERKQSIITLVREGYKELLSAD
jgi:hypothetical protein